MDPATIIGILLAFGAVGTMVTLEGGQLTSLLLLPPMVLVFGATLSIHGGDAAVDVPRPVPVLPGTAPESFFRGVRQARL